MRKAERSSLELLSRAHQSLQQQRFHEGGDASKGVPSTTFRLLSMSP